MVGMAVIGVPESKIQFFCGADHFSRGLEQMDEPD